MNETDVETDTTSSSLSQLIKNMDIDIKQETALITTITPLYCSNCGKLGHIYKKCKDPITSIGVILLYIDNNYMFNKIENKYIYKNLFERYQNSKYIFKKIYLNRFNEKNFCALQIPDLLEIYKSMIKKSIKFLLIQRKFSVGFIEFMRGRYDEMNTEFITFIFNQMTPLEVKNIEHKDFDYLWNNMWNNKYINIPLDIKTIEELDSYDLTLSEKKIYLKIHLKEYNISKKKFMYIKENNIIKALKLDLKYDEPEWGFPKGRRNIYEQPLECALREFEEETNINKNNINILDRISPLNEYFVGTNNINYKHTYYLSITSKCDTVDVTTENQYIEIGNIGWFTYEQMIGMIRPYHKSRLSIIDTIIDFMAYNYKYYQQAI